MSRVKVLRLFAFRIRNWRSKKKMLIQTLNLAPIMLDSVGLLSADMANKSSLIILSVNRIDGAM